VQKDARNGHWRLHPWARNALTTRGKNGFWVAARYNTEVLQKRAQKIERMPPR
jgi:hypothetical protein